MNAAPGGDRYDELVIIREDSSAPRLHRMVAFLSLHGVEAQIFSREDTAFPQMGYYQLLVPRSSESNARTILEEYHD